MARVTDLTLGTLVEAVYADEEPSEGPAAGFKIFKTAGNDDSGLGAILYTKQAEVGLPRCKAADERIERAVAAPAGQLAKPLIGPASRGGQGAAVFSFRGTDSSKSQSIKGQMRCA